jgi:hypothetical protein
MGKLRELTEEEKKACNKSIERLGDEILVGEDYVEYYSLMAKKILFRNFQQTKKRYERELKNIMNDLEEKRHTIAELKKQLIHGVEEKEEHKDISPKILSKTNYKGSYDAK